MKSDNPKSAADKEAAPPEVAAEAAKDAKVAAAEATTAKAAAEAAAGAATAEAAADPTAVEFDAGDEVDYKALLTRSEKAHAADLIIERHMLAAMGVGLAPFPVIDFVGVLTVQINMLRKLAKVYDVEFSHSAGKSVLAAVIGGALPAYLSMPVSSLVRVVPIIGWSLGNSTMLILSGASTYAAGQVFKKHFAEGGSLVDFDAKKAKAGFKEMFRRGKELATFQRKAAA